MLSQFAPGHKCTRVTVFPYVSPAANSNKIATKLFDTCQKLYLLSSLLCICVSTDRDDFALQKILNYSQKLLIWILERQRWNLSTTKNAKSVIKTLKYWDIHQNSNNCDPQSYFPSAKFCLRNSVCGCDSVCSTSLSIISEASVE